MSNNQLESTNIRPASDADRSAVEELLVANSLPLGGVAHALGGFLIAEADGRVVGAAGIEECERYGLLRSVVVDRSWRSRGLGRELVERGIAAAETRGLKSLYLLTTTAERYFPAFGFSLTTRDKVPPCLRETAEFQGACPASAVVMVRAIRAGKGEQG